MVGEKEGKVEAILAIKQLFRGKKLDEEETKEDHRSDWLH